MGQINKQNEKTANDLISMARRKRRTWRFGQYLLSNVEDFKKFKNVAIVRKLNLCRAELKLSLNSKGESCLFPSRTCNIAMLCPNCAYARAVKYCSIYFKKYLVLKERHNIIRLYYAVFTIPNKVDLNEGYQLLISSFKKMIQHRREALSAKRTGSSKHQAAISYCLSDTIAGAYSVEIKKGKNSKIWHPHLNCLLVTPTPINYTKLQNEWNLAVGSNANLHSELLTEDNELKHFQEIFKYSLKFSDMEFTDNIQAYKLLKGCRLFGSFGEFRGLKIEKDDIYSVTLNGGQKYYFDGQEYKHIF